MKNIVAVLALCAAVHAQQAKLYTLHNFNGTTEGKAPVGALISDQAGNLYGVTSLGGGKNAACYQNANDGCGTVFELVAPPSRGGTWTLQTLYRFTGGVDGGLPAGGLVMNAQGFLYGVTNVGGDMTNPQCMAGAEYIGCGVVFQLNSVRGGWAETVLHTFESIDGAAPNAALIFDTQGNLYGTTELGGSAAWGTVFELSGAPYWTETVLYNFGLAGDGEFPMGNLVFDGLGNLYGTTYEGGSGGYGTVFELSPGAPSWTETLLANFTGTMSSYPMGGLIFDASGNLYGTSSGGGQGTDCPSDGCGSVFELTPADGSWTETVLFNFDAGKSSMPGGNLIADPAENLYSTSDGRNCGSVFRLLNSTWVEAEIDLFADTGKACGPNTPTFGKFGGLYASSIAGGTSRGTCFAKDGCGTIFAVYQ
jgi:uncharacterized repeat protein (TIGR03803 family)